MKMTIVFLVVLGLVAAICAVFLVQAVRIDILGRGAKSKEVQVVTVKKDLPMMSVITSDSIETITMKRDDAPAGFLSSPAQTIGKILAKPVVAQEVLTNLSFITQGSSAQLMAAVPPGMRAFEIMLSSRNVSGGLLYPGCVVDVLASFKLAGSSNRGDSKGEAISTTLLREIQVLAVRDESVMSKPETEDDETAASKGTSSSRQNLSVTLLLDPRQAEALQLAMDNGSIALSMRNPLDSTPVDLDATVLSRGRLSKLGSLMGTSVNNPRRAVEEGATYMPAIAADGTAILPEGQEAANPLDAFSMWNGEPSSWDVTVIRGKEVKEEEVKVSE